MPMTDDDRYQDWIGRSETLRDVIDANRANGLRVTLDSLDPPLAAGAALPELWHWCYFWELAPQAGLGPEGHTALGGFLPPIDLPRRMWAGSRLTWHRPLRIGESVERRSTIRNVTLKQGRSGRLAFVTVEHRLSGPEGLAIEEEHDIVYRAAAEPGQGPRRAPEAAPDPVPDPTAEAVPWTRSIAPDPVLLFRYSALSFNGHRIHYDLPYTTGEEGYPGLIVHGPLMATLMVDLARRHIGERRIAGFEFRALSPSLDTAPFTVAGRPSDGGAELWIAGPAGEYALRGSLRLD
jgi:3-methylfumaryl-CoA hydratase